MEQSTPWVLKMWVFLAKKWERLKEDDTWAKS